MNTKDFMWKHNKFAWIYSFVVVGVTFFAQDYFGIGNIVSQIAVALVVAFVFNIMLNFVLKMVSKKEEL